MNWKYEKKYGVARNETTEKSELLFIIASAWERPTTNDHNSRRRKNNIARVEVADACSEEEFPLFLIHQVFQDLFKFG